jgi:single-strand DNA-binding protein
VDTNHVVLFGRLGRDPELRTTPGGDPLVSFAIANSSWKKDASEKSGWKEETSWFDCTLFGDAAKRFVERSKKGHRVIVTGQLKQRKWKDKDDNWQERIGVQVRGVQYLEKKPRSDEGTIDQGVTRDEVPF